MKKNIVIIALALIIAVSAGFAVGYHFGTQEPQSKALTRDQHQPELATSATNQTINIEATVAQQRLKEEQLTKELQAKNSEIKRLKKVIENAAPTEPKLEEEVIPATTYERTSFVTNLIHQFNADNASTDIVDIDCKDNLCYLTANISAGSQTNPEIANLMKFMDDKKLPSYYREVKLLSVTKKDNHNEIKLSLDM